ncbi:hypothetical protein F2Q68_00003734 [Brassica cretica]|uniref:Uncharacterized protein n=1 Tax=Brassica cretica TaxID=69181 RepID=A0A8S9JA14_BRACR|nr:hypothetical protein F2Q68_00003734 [Brassica cretica]
MAATKMVFQFWKTSGLEDFQTTSRKSSNGVLIRWFSSSTWICSLSESDFGRPMESLLGSLLKYNALEDFQEVFQTTSKKSSRRLQRSLPDDFKEVSQEVFQTTSTKSSTRLPGSLLTGSSSISSGV